MYRFELSDRSSDGVFEDKSWLMAKLEGNPVNESLKKLQRHTHANQPKETNKSLATVQVE